MRKPSRKALVRKLDNVFSEFIRKRDKHCVVCGTRENLTCGHLFSRIAYSTRWDEMNAFGQCMGCNLRHEHDAYPFTKWFIGRFGQDRWDDLHRQYSAIRKFSNQDLQALTMHFETKTETL